MLKIKFNSPRQKYTVATYKDQKSNFTIRTNKYNTQIALELLNNENGGNSHD